MNIDEDDDLAIAFKTSTAVTQNLMIDLTQCFNKHCHDRGLSQNQEMKNTKKRVCRKLSKYYADDKIKVEKAWKSLEYLKTTDCVVALIFVEGMSFETQALVLVEMVVNFKRLAAIGTCNSIVQHCLMMSADGAVISVIDLLMAITPTKRGVSPVKMLQRQITALERQDHFEGIVDALARHFGVSDKEVFIKQPSLVGGKTLYKTPYPELAIYIARHMSDAINQFCLDTTGSSLLKSQQDDDEDDDINNALQLDFRQDARKSSINMI